VRVPPGRSLRRPLAAVALAALTACAIGPLQPDLAARAPALGGFGTIDVPVTTQSDAARRLFQHGVLQAYAFNEKEAVRQFKAALAADPACAICAWGVAWQLGPNINAPDRDESGGDLKEARQYVVHAQRHAAAATARERSLIEAMAVRYGVAERASIAAAGPGEGDVCRGAKSGKGAKPAADPLDTAYAERLHALLLASPDDNDLLTLWSEAAMIATKDDWWDETTGKPAPRIGEMVDRIERALVRSPNHTGLNHYMIHAADSAAGASRAVAAADRLGTLAPNSPHLVHMPSHIYARVGRYAEAAQVNEKALAADAALDEVQKTQGFSITKDWRGHNTHFLWYAALMQGRGDAALAAARTLVERAKDRDHTFAEVMRSLPLLTLLRLERWDAVLAEPLPVGERGMAQVLAAQAQGSAQARLGRSAESKSSLVTAEAALKKVHAAHAGDDEFDIALRDMASAAASRLRAEIALAEKRGDDALAEQALAVAASKRADDSEPPLLAAGATLTLADMQLALGRAAAAEATYREDLKARPDSGWALQGLARALAAQGKSAEAAAMRERVERAWAQAEAGLKARS
jgi:tetratricopeptide (TPR) repeat protein